MRRRMLDRPSGSSTQSRRCACGKRRQVWWTAVDQRVKIAGNAVLICKTPRDKTSRLHTRPRADYNTRRTIPFSTRAGPNDKRTSNKKDRREEPSLLRGMLAGIFWSWHLQATVIALLLNVDNISKFDTICGKRRRGILQKLNHYISS